MSSIGQNGYLPYYGVPITQPLQTQGLQTPLQTGVYSPQDLFTQGNGLTNTQGLYSPFYTSYYNPQSTTLQSLPYGNMYPQYANTTYSPYSPNTTSFNNFPQMGLSTLGSIPQSVYQSLPMNTLGLTNTSTGTLPLTQFAVQSPLGNYQTQQTYETSTFDPTAEANRILPNALGEALNLPSGFNNLNLSNNYASLVPSLGDFTGLTNFAVMSATSELYKREQQILSAKSYLETHDTRELINPNFSYIKGQPPFGKATPAQQQQQLQVIAAMKTNIISRLAQVAQQLNEAATGIKTQGDFANKFRSTQDQWVSQSIQKASGGNKA